MYPNVTPDSPSNFCPQRIHIFPNDPGCVQHTSTSEDASATTKNLQHFQGKIIKLYKNHINSCTNMRKYCAESESLQVKSLAIVVYVSLLYK